jgi:pyruvate dehydrogenase E1 component
VVPKPDLTAYAQFAVAAGGKEMSTTVAFVRMLGALLKDPSLGPRIVPIVADEARTFGMANLFRQVGSIRAWDSGTHPRTSTPS